MKFPVHRGIDGSFQELAHNDNVDFGQLSVLTVNPLCSRGGHYHKRKVEWFCCIVGTGILETINIETKERKTHVLNGFKSREFIKVSPGLSHKIINRDPYVSLEVLIIISEKYNSETADTYIYEEKKNE